MNVYRNGEQYQAWYWSRHSYTAMPGWLGYALLCGEAKLHYGDGAACYMMLYTADEEGAPISKVARPGDWIVYRNGVRHVVDACVFDNLYLRYEDLGVEVLASKLSIALTKIQEARHAE